MSALKEWGDCVASERQEVLYFLLNHVLVHPPKKASLASTLLTLFIILQVKLAAGSLYSGVGFTNCCHFGSP